MSYGGETVALFDEVVSYLLLRSGCHAVPVDLARIGKRLAVDSVEEREIAQEGFVESRSANTFRIVLRSDRPLVRKRFSWAHELGHLIVDKLEGANSSALGRRYRESSAVATNLDAESKADFIAGMLLLPMFYMNSKLPEQFDLERIYDISREAQVSFATALIRAMWLATHPCYAFMCRAYTDEPSRLTCHWVRSSRSAENIDRAEFLKRVGIEQCVRKSVAVTKRVASFRAVDRWPEVGQLELKKLTFGDKISIFGLFQPSLALSSKAAQPELIRSQA